MTPASSFSETYYASIYGTATAKGTYDDPFDLQTGVKEVKQKAHTLILKNGTYKITDLISLSGPESTTSRTVLRGETDDPADVIIDAQGKTEAMMLNYNVLVSGITITNGVSGTSANKNSTKAGGISICFTSQTAASSKGRSVVSNCVVTCCKNNFISSYGGAVCVYNNGLLVDSTVTGNTSIHISAGVWMQGGEVRGCTISGNTAARFGGGMFVTGKNKVAVLDSVFDGNGVTANGANFVGGAIAVSNQTAGASLMVSNCVFRNNYCSYGRGGTFSGAWGSPVYAELVDCVFTNNTVYRQGGAVMIRDDDQSDTTTRFRMRNCLVARNTAKINGTANQASGAGVYLSAYSNPVLESCTIVSNNATSVTAGEGPGLFHNRSGSVKNCIIAFNTAGGKEDKRTTWCLGGTNPAAYQHCCFWPALSDSFLADNGCLNEDPKFTDAAAGDYTLTSGSPCRDAGINMDWMQGARDLAGLRRISGSTVDIGCYEFFRQLGLAIIVR